MYELAKPSQLRAGPPLRDAGLPGVHMIVLGPNGSDHLPQKWRPQVCPEPAKTRGARQVLLHTHTMGHTYRISLLACDTEAT